MAEESNNTNQGDTNGSGAAGSTTDVKMSKLLEENTKLSQQISELASVVQQVVTSKNQPPARSSQLEDEDLENLAYKDPKAYARKVEERAEARAMQRVDAALSNQSRQQAILSQLGSEYPELNDASSDLTIKAVENFKRMTPEERSAPGAYKIAVRDAAADLGVLPKAKRKVTSSETPEFSSGSTSTQAGSQRSSSKKLDGNTLVFAKLIGLNTEDPKVVENLKKRAQRTNWKKYE